MPTSISELQTKYESLLESEVVVAGWVVTTRAQKDFTFIKINDGSHAGGVQVVVAGGDSYPVGASLEVRGRLIKSPAAGQLFEIQGTAVRVLGGCASSYPLSKSKMSLEYLRGYAHLRARTNTFGSVFRIKSAISQATHKFFDGQGFLHLDPNIMTVNECEGGAGVFQVTEKDISIPGRLELAKEDVVGADGKVHKRVTDRYDWSKDHFGKPVYLTVSSQLQLEALACSLGSVYTTNKSFRSEHSSTGKHLSEFSHLEIETCFCGLDDLMDIGEAYIKFVGSYLLTEAAADVENLGKFISKGIEERIRGILGARFHRVRYAEAVALAAGAGKAIAYGEDLSSEIENFLTEHFAGPVFVTHWPFAIKSFYMKQYAEDPSLCENFDLLMPYKVGELIGGSMREDNYDVLLAAMMAKGVSAEPMQFYTDLRKYGAVPHGGFGLGLDRMTMLFTGMENIRDVVPFPVAYRSCDF